MATGISLHIGLNTVDPDHYNGWDGKLMACEADARDMAAIVEPGGFKPTILLTKQATRAAVSHYLAKAASHLKKGDCLILSYSGHGGQVPDHNKDESDNLDETWCLYDGEMIDDELYNSYGKFAEGVRIAVFSDSCHSGTVIKNQLLAAAHNRAGPAPRYRAMPPEYAQSVYLKHQKFYDKLQAEPVVAADDIAATVVLVSGCQDNQFSQDGTFNGAFTGTLKSVWNGSTFKKKGYRALHKAILKQMPPDQSPNYFAIGKKDAKFNRMKPFTLEG